MSRSARRDSSEFTEQARRMVVTDSRPIAQVARELDISVTSLSTWLKAYRPVVDGEPR